MLELKTSIKHRKGIVARQSTATILHETAERAHKRLVDAPLRPSDGPGLPHPVEEDVTGRIPELPDRSRVGLQPPVGRDRFPLLLDGVDDFHNIPPFLYGIMSEAPDGRHRANAHASNGRNKEPETNDNANDSNAG